MQMPSRKRCPATSVELPCASQVRLLDSKDHRLQQDVAVALVNASLYVPCRMAILRGDCLKLLPALIRGNDEQQERPRGRCRTARAKAVLAPRQSQPLVDSLWRQPLAIASDDSPVIASDDSL